ncbi:Bile salt-activated lipase [Eumeta japonica]|uniref:Carboxylic ester hydrolase n=1 Tax=Eumeta variegata TaxID=151549 RepID=A0A4C1UZS2_EUMVA|nr:Bile salt-activated lipase [Eumeta japonica]
MRAGTWRRAWLWARWGVLVAMLAWLSGEPAPTVRVHTGWVRGRLSADGQFYHYKGVPYATITPETRFRAPLEVPPWSGVLDATVGTRCLQHMFLGVLMGQVDCLTLDVAVPIKRTDRNLPVMVYIHGGGFQYGTGSDFLYGPDYLVRQEVIVVGINYRLSIEGFLCLGTETAPGNAGLKDQVAALRWIKRNIAAFGGDPDNVTLFGESAGAVSTSMLVLSPLARGLFHRVIAQSGSSLSPWAVQHRPLHLAAALAERFGYRTEDPHELYQVYANRTPEELVRARMSIHRSDSITAELLFVPCVERDIPGVEAFITEHPLNVIRSGNYTKVPMIIGYNDNEGIYFLAMDYGISPKMLDISRSIQSDLVFAEDSEKTIVAKKIADHYSLEKLDLSRMIDLYSDLYFKFPIVNEAMMYAETTDQPIYYYVFKYSGWLNMAKVIVGYGGVTGASHGDELFYLFRPQSFPQPQRLFELHMIEKMTVMWTNFAKYGDPTPTSSEGVRWKPGVGVNPSALHIDQRCTVAPFYDETTMRMQDDDDLKISAGCCSIDV